MNDRKAIILDLDGTLLTRDKTVSVYTADVITRCIERGHLIIIATARPLRLVTDHLPDIFRSAYWVVYNGAWICRNGEIVTRDEIDPETALEIARMLISKGLAPGIEADDCNYSDREAEPGFERYHRPLHEYRDRPACKILSLINNGVSKADVAALVPDELTYVITDDDSLVQISSGTCTKVNACIKILELEDVAADDTYVFGDDNNDVPLFRVFRNSFAMANATNDLKAYARHTVPSNDDDGVGIGIATHILP